MSRKTQRLISKWLNWKTGVAVLAVLLIAALILQFTVGWGKIIGSLFGTAGPAGGQTCLPTCNTGPNEDGKFLSLPGEKMASFDGAKITIWITVPGDWGSFELGFFDGDSGKDINNNPNNWRNGNWDDTTAETTYILYADPLKKGGGVELQRWSSNEMPNNAWYNLTLNTDARAKVAGKDYIYRLEAVRGLAGGGINAFKLRSTAFLSAGNGMALEDSQFAFVGMLGSPKDIPILFPDYTGNMNNPGRSVYQGTWDFYFYVPTDTVLLEVWDGDFDQGPWTSTDAPDSDDPNTSGKPAWAYNARDEGAWGRGSPADDASHPMWRRSPSVQYTIIDARGQPIYINIEPSGSSEWERFAVTTRPDLYPVPNVADASTDALVPGWYTWHIEGLDVHNTVWIYTAHEICPIEDCPNQCKGTCPRTIGYWKNNVKKVLIENKTKGVQETRASLESALNIVAQYSELYRSGLNVAAPAPIANPVRLTDQEAHAILQKAAGNTMLDRALQQNLATWLNMASGKVCPDTYIEINVPSGLYQGTVWQALMYAQDIILYHRDDAFLLERAKDIADMINNAQINVDPDELSCDAYTQIIPPAKQPKDPKDTPKGPKPPEPPQPVVGCDNPRVNTYGVENPTNNPFYGIKFEFQSGTEIKDGLYDEFRFTLPAGVVEGMGSIQLEAKAGTDQVISQLTLSGCQFGQTAPCDNSVTDGNFTFGFQGSIDNGDGTLTLVFWVWNYSGHGLSHATFGLPAGQVPSSPGGNYQSQVCP